MNNDDDNMNNNSIYCVEKKTNYDEVCGQTWKRKKAGRKLKCFVKISALKK